MALPMLRTPPARARSVIDVPCGLALAAVLTAWPGAMPTFPGVPGLSSAGSAPATPASETESATAAPAAANTFLIISAPYFDSLAVAHVLRRLADPRSQRTHAARV